MQAGADVALDVLAEAEEELVEEAPNEHAGQVQALLPCCIGVGVGLGTGREDGTMRCKISGAGGGFKQQQQPWCQ